jgi:hypothetical protein
MSAMFVVQSYRAGKRGALLAESPVEARDSAHARRMAERLAVRKALVVAFMQEGDPKTGDYDDAKLIAAFGAVPEEIQAMPRA